MKQLESALAQAEPRQASARQDLAHPEQFQIPDSSKDNSSHITTLPSGRERVYLSESSSPSLVFSQTAKNTHQSATADYDAGVNGSAYQLGPNWFFNGMPIFSEVGRQWVSKKTDQDITWAEVCIPMMEPSTLSALPSSFSQEDCDLPNQDATREILKGFFWSSFRLTFPVLDEVLFETTMQTAYEPVDTNRISLTEAAARACVLAALSIAICLNTSHQSTYSIDADVCAAKANSLLLRFTGEISLETLQTILLLVSPNFAVARPCSCRDSSSICELATTSHVQWPLEKCCCLTFNGVSHSLLLAGAHLQAVKPFWA